MGPMGDTNFGDQDLLSGKLYVSKQSGAVEGWLSHIMEKPLYLWNGVALLESLKLQMKKTFSCTEEQAEKIKELIKSMRKDQYQEQEPR